MVMALLAKLLMTKQLKFEGGYIDMKNITMSLVPTFFISELTKYFRNKNELDKFYFISWYWGYVLVRKINEKFNLKTPEQIYSFGMDMAEAMGIGLYQTRDYSAGNYTHFTIKSPYIPFLADIKERKPIDHFIAGAMAGGGCHVHNAVCQNVEVACMLAGDKMCEFLTGTETELRKRGLWETAKSRYNLEKYYPLQKEIFSKYDETREAEILTMIINELTYTK
ncbi:MAG: hypothetical protein HYS53_02940 [Candidatus Aenigmarchaeota archaeon]|nr:hypothetical protein [Candidatus Aenigmarchaeota archaeon]